MSSSGSTLVCLALLAAPAALGAQGLCDPGAEVLRAISGALAGVPPDAPYDQRIAPLRDLRDRFERDLFVHVRYQDAVFESGIEGHLRELLEEYLELQAKHPGDPLYLYLSGRAFEGRGTKRAIAIMEQVLALDAEFAPAYRTLAEIYGSEAFRDRRREALARRKFAAICPRSAIVRRPLPLPPHSTFFARLDEENLSPEEEEAIPAQVHAALQQDEWRALRIRLFDWYSAREREQALHGLQAEYWQAWRVLVRHDRRTGRAAEADRLLAQMEERLFRLQRGRHATTFSLAATMVLGLHADAGHWDKVRAVLDRLDKSLEESSDRRRAAELDRVRAAFAARARTARR